MIVKLNDIPVFFVKSKNGIAGSEKTFLDLEAVTGTKGRKFYGLVYGKPPREIYFACTKIKNDDNLRLEKMTIPGGLYAKAKIRNWTNNKKLIGKTFSNLAKNNKIEAIRPCIEFYKSLKELICFLPLI